MLSKLMGKKVTPEPEVQSLVKIEKRQNIVDGEVKSTSFYIETRRQRYMENGTSYDSSLTLSPDQFLDLLDEIDRKFPISSVDADIKLRRSNLEERA